MHLIDYRGFTRAKTSDKVHFLAGEKRLSLSKEQLKVICNEFEETLLAGVWNLRPRRNRHTSDPTSEARPRHTSSSRKKLSCKQCSKTFGTQRTLREHIESRHPPDVYPCPKCSESFTNKSDLTKHVKSHSSKKLTCSCGQQFSSKAKLDKHSHTHKSSVYQCALCNMCFKSQRGLNGHMRVHSNLNRNATVNMASFERKLFDKLKLASLGQMVNVFCC